MNTSTSNFYEWFAKLGGCLSSLKDIERTNKPVILLHNNLKGRASEIKEKYNYKFKQSND